jgi:hypothetical protein
MPTSLRPRRCVCLCVLLALSGCGSELPVRPVPLEPAGGEQVATDSPVFTVQNALGFDGATALYTFRVAVARSDREVARLTAPGGNETTSVRFPTPLLRGAELAWSVEARNGAEAVASERATFRLPPLTCSATGDSWAKRVTEWWVPATCLQQNRYNEPSDVLGPPDAGGTGPDAFFGFMSLGDGGFVSVDMEGCAADGQGGDLRVFQAVGSEPVTLYVSSGPTGPWVLVGFRQICDNRLPGVFSRYCDFDLAEAGIEETRYLKVEDGELFPCPGDTTSEGADIDAVMIVNRRAGP